SGGTAVYIPASTVANTTYSWSIVSPLPSGVAGPASGTASGSSPSISLSFTNTTPVTQSITIRVVPTNPAQNPCAGPAFDLILHINPKPPAPVLEDTVHFCMGTPAIALTSNALPGHLVKWYDQ